MTDVDGVHNYMYDTLYQIIQATHPSIPNPLEQFTYDTAGNRLTDLIHDNYQYNELNQLIEDDSCMYNYNADGNMTEKVSKSTGDTTHFIWDIENRLIEVRKPGTIARYIYDALGRRMSKEVNGVKKQFRYDGQNLILEMGGTDTIMANYTFGLGIDNPLMMNRTANNYYYTKDGLGSVTALTDSTGNVVHEYKYSVYGEIVEETGNSVENPFTYTSREIDRETGLMYYRARYYDPELGRFLSEDPIGFLGDNVNLYAITQNNTINFTDPLGWEEGGSGQAEQGKKEGEKPKESLQEKFLTPEMKSNIANVIQTVTNGTFNKDETSKITSAVASKVGLFDLKVALQVGNEQVKNEKVELTEKELAFLVKKLNDISKDKDASKELKDLAKKALEEKEKAIKDSTCLIVPK
jgi:RHS repeat-associated protein